MKFFLTLLVLASLTSCATKNVKKEVREKAATETTKDGAALGSTIQDQINNSKTLTAEQKTQLFDLMKTNKATADALTEESFKFRSVLIKELLSGKADAKKVKIIKADIKRIEDKKLKNTFDTVEKISKIVSNNPEHHNSVEHVMNMDRPIQ